MSEKARSATPDETEAHAVKPDTAPLRGSIDTPEKIISESLRLVQVALDQTGGGDDAISSDDPRWYHVIAGGVINFGLAFVMETLRRVDPAVAERAARELWDIWDAGDSIGELTWEWRQQMAAGEPIDSGRAGQGYVFHRVLTDEDRRGDQRAPLAAFHVPQIAQQRDGRWGVFCAACSWQRGDYVYPCQDGRGWVDEMPPGVLTGGSEAEGA